MIKVELTSGGHEKRSANVDINNSVFVTDTGIPPSNLKSSLRPFSSFMLDSNGSSDMKVSASLTGFVDYEIGSSSDGDRYINALAFTISDSGAVLNKFGNITELINGCQLIFQDEIAGNVIIADSLKSNFDFVQMCGFFPSFGDGTAAFRASNVFGSSEAYVPILKSDLYGLKNGLHIPKNSTKKLILRIRDNVSGVDRFDVKAFGFDRIDG